MSSNRHDGVSCDACGANNFSGDRYKCLMCFDYDLCADCYRRRTYLTQGVTPANPTTPGTANNNNRTTALHTPEHAMQLVLTALDFNLTYHGEPEPLPIDGVRCMVFTCPLCGQASMQIYALYEHIRTHHANARPLVICPVCACSPNADPNRRVGDLVTHLERDHLANFTGGTGSNRVRRNNQSNNFRNFGIVYDESENGFVVTQNQPTASSATTRGSGSSRVRLHRMAALRERRYGGGHQAVGGLSTHFARGGALRTSLRIPPRTQPPLPPQLPTGTVPEEFRDLIAQLRQDADLARMIEELQLSDQMQYLRGQIHQLDEQRRTTESTDSQEIGNAIEIFHGGGLNDLHYMDGHDEDDDDDNEDDLDDDERLAVDDIVAMTTGDNTARAPHENERNEVSSRLAQALMSSRIDSNTGQEYVSARRRAQLVSYLLNRHRSEVSAPITVARKRADAGIVADKTNQKYRNPMLLHSAGEFKVDRDDEPLGQDEAGTSQDFAASLGADDLMLDLMVEQMMSEMDDGIISDNDKKELRKELRSRLHATERQQPFEKINEEENADKECHLRPIDEIDHPVALLRFDDAATDADLLRKLGDLDANTLDQTFDMEQ